MRLFTILFSLLLTVSAFGQVSGNGFYRVKNVFTKRYLHVMDNRGSVSLQATSADVEAIVPYCNFENAVSNPATVIYFDELPDEQYKKKYNFYAQGTNVHSIIDHYVLLLAEKDGTYRCYATDKGVSLYLADTNDDLSDEEGSLETVKASWNNPTEAKKWYVEPISAASDNYFGIQPTITIGNKHYATFYAAFAFNTVSNGMKVYKVSKNAEDMAVWEEINGIIPAATPVIIECSSTNPSNNRIDWVANSSSTINTNLLKGNYFRNGEQYKDTYKHKNVTAYNAQTMRVLGKTADGKLGFVTTTDKYLDANSAYLPVNAETSAELKLVTQAEYDELHKPVYYTITYTIDGEVFKTETYKAGASITALANPTKEGYTFSGWSEIPQTMPNGDITITGTFTVNTYTITYIVDGEAYKTESCKYGAAIALIANPVKEGYTFSGWSTTPATMPANDITVTGTFTVNTYTITYMVDGEAYKTESCKYGVAIALIANPVKEGYTFSGWSTTPTTMPANDITVTGTFTVNTYTITYMVDGEVYKTVACQYGAAVTPIAAPEKEGYNFSGWSEIPATMPAGDITVSGNFIADAIASTKTDDDKVIYNAVGVRMNATTPLRSGLYIVNGKKVVIK